MKILIRYILLLGLVCTLVSCHSDYLDAKPQKSLLVPTTLKDMEALLNNSRNVMNIAGYLSLAADGDFRISDSYLSSTVEAIRFNYTWSDETTSWIGDWDYAYQQIFYANVVLQALGQMKEIEDISKANELKGRALFYRAWALHLVAQQFAGVYTKETAANSLGIPCPIIPDVNEPIKRVSLELTYNRIFSDLYEALDLLPDRATFITQPSKGSAYCLLARLYLITGDYDMAAEAAENSLSLNSTLFDYNLIDSNRAVSFPVPLVNNNPEVLYYTIGNTVFTGSLNTFVDSSLYNLYEKGDLRKTLFFTSNRNYKGSYTGNTTPFVGLAVDEVYLIKAECLARKGDINGSRNTLNSFLSKRYKSQMFKEIIETDSKKLLKIILLERRKQLIGRGTSWIDLRRLNKEPGFERTLTRFVGGQVFTLQPGNKRYIMKIPLEEVSLSGIEQNP